MCIQHSIESPVKHLLIVEQVVDEERTKIRHLLHLSKVTAREHHARVRVDGQGQSDLQVHVVDPPVCHLSLKYINYRTWFWVESMQVFEILFVPLFSMQPMRIDLRIRFSLVCLI